MSRGDQTRGRSHATRLLTMLAAALFFGGLVFMVTDGLDTGSSATKPAREAAQAKTKAKAAVAKRPAATAKQKQRTQAQPVALTGVSGLDPYGDGRENDEAAGQATDKDALTAWRTETYSTFFKEGVGLLLDAGRNVRLSRLVLSTDTPGFRADVRVGTAPAGPFTPVSDAVTTTTSTSIRLRPQQARYVVLWIVGLADGSAAHVNEIRAFAQPPAAAAA